MAEGSSRRVLVLNRLWQAVNIIGVQRTFALLCQEHARVLNPQDGSYQIYDPADWITYSIENPPRNPRDCIHTVRYSIRIPRILLLNHYSKLPMKEVRFSRDSVYERDSFTCQYCGEVPALKDLNLDHVIPRDRGGRTTWENIVTSCRGCNSRKANRLPHEAGMRLTRRPQRPRFRPFVSFMIGETNRIPDSWEPFLSASSS